MLDMNESMDDLRERIAALVDSHTRLGKHVQHLMGLLERVQRAVGGETLGDAVARVEAMRNRGAGPSGKE